MTATFSRLLTCILILAAALLIIDGYWIKVKAVLAQLLLQRAWAETIAVGDVVKPWPWADTWPIARLHVERLGTDYIVLEGESGEVLAFGPGHVEKSSQPLSGGNCILVGHRDTSFRFLQYLQKGDVLKVEDAKGRTGQYHVTSTQVVDFHNLYLEKTQKPWLTLITCYPFESLNPGGSLRYVVFARGIDAF